MYSSFLVRAFLFFRGAMNSGSRVPKTSLINITYGKTRKGHVVEPAEKLKSRGDSQFIRRKDKRLFAGKECHTSKTKVRVCFELGRVGDGHKLSGARVAVGIKVFGVVLI